MTTSQVTDMFRIRDITKMTRLPRTVIYQQIRAERMRTVKQGRATLIQPHGRTPHP
jgi:hypothetical protein